VPHPATQASKPVPAARNAAWWVPSLCPLRRCSLWKVVGDLFADATSMVGKQKTPVSSAAARGLRVDGLDQSGTNAQADYYELSRSVHRPTTVASVLVKRQIPVVAGPAQVRRCRRRRGPVP